MKRLIQCAALVTFAVFTTGCATTCQNYVMDRGRDAIDVVTVGVGVGLGAKARVGPIQSGLLFDIPVTSFRCGDIVSVELTEFGPSSMDFQAVAWGGESFQGVTPPRNKSFGAANLFYAVPFVYAAEGKGDIPPIYYYTQLEVVVDVGVGLRLGFNPGELLDFILGWTTIDIFRDDRHDTEYDIFYYD